MNSRTGNTHKRNSYEGLIFGFLGVLAFSYTLPATRMAVASLDPVFVGLGRARLPPVWLLLCSLRQDRC